MGARKDVNRFTFRQRDSRKVKLLEILTSNNGSSWTSLGDFTLLDTTTPQDIILSTVKNFKYFKLNMKSSYDGAQFAALSEVGTYKD
ncbi:F5/8 type C domain protein [compost metagenome]